MKSLQRERHHEDWNMACANDATTWKGEKCGKRNEQRKQDMPEMQDMPRKKILYVKDNRFICSGAEKQGLYGVGIVLDQDHAMKVIKIDDINERIMMIKLDTVPVKTTIIYTGFYMPTSNSKDEEVIMLLYMKSQKKLWEIVVITIS